MLDLVLVQGIFGGLALLVLLVVVALYRPHHLRRRMPASTGRRIAGAVNAVADRVTPEPAPPQGLLTTPAKARRASARFEQAERRVTRSVEAVLEKVGAR